MIKDIKCECGHPNPVGTVLCEYCGKPLDEKMVDEGPIDMRYEGKARRSQTFSNTVIDRIWNFFSSVKVAIWLIVIILIVSALGTIFPQERYIPSPKPELYYEETYGFWGKVYFETGLYDVYQSWVFVFLLGLLSASLIICSLDRVVPLYQALKHQRVKKSPLFIQRQRYHVEETMSAAEAQQHLDQMHSALEKKRYRVRRDDGAMLAEKGRVSRWGPYILHIGLILFFFGTFLRLIPGWSMDEFIWIRDGETKQLPAPYADYHLKNVKAETILYEEEDLAPGVDKSMAQQSVKEYRTKLELFKKGEDGELEKVKQGSTEVNHPFKYEELLLYQSALEPRQSELELVLVDEDKGDKELGRFTVDLFKPDSEQDLGDGIKVQMLDYFPDFVMDSGKPTTRSEVPNRPAMVFHVTTPEKPEGEKMWVIAGVDWGKIQTENRYNINFGSIKHANETGLMVRTEKSLPIIFFGAAIGMLGLIVGFYWQHRRVWFRYDEGTMYVGTHTNKNWYGFTKEVEKAAEQAKWPLTLREKR
ncbi:cytochrome c biogenesis protein ResB [Mechercharimyces sp. CAU 1602]|uniref:cytochrome c biogenesis protein ResB n=1 Tax=Mechercharimyces sp. CAU 1602 TaxID=2973933 RepID=UPI0021625307|nr:cytochrome c biogenesis protein ResB [Mechercharimyces sp. CAU 1602]MCS1350929.1 cytochrome c biogenesis protein ResB [Mechercharimyces sp. CAU 1602]